MHRRDRELGSAGHVGRDLHGVSGLDPEVELLAKAVGELLGELADVVVARPGRARLDGLGQLEQHLDVALHGLGDPRPLHFDHDFLAAVEPAPVGLADGCGRQGVPFDLGKGVPDGPAELRLQQLPHLVGILGRHPVLEVRELLDEGRRQQVPARGEDLAQLHEHAAAVLQGVRDAVRQPRRPLQVLVVLVPADAQIGSEPVARRNSRQLQVAEQAAEPEADGVDRAGNPRRGAAGEGRGLGDELEEDRGQHREHDCEDVDVASELDRLGLVVGQDQGQGDRRQPSQEPGDDDPEP